MWQKRRKMPKLSDTEVLDIYLQETATTVHIAACFAIEKIKAALAKGVPPDKWDTYKRALRKWEAIAEFDPNREAS